MSPNAGGGSRGGGGQFYRPWVHIGQQGAGAGDHEDDGILSSHFSFEVLVTRHSGPPLT